MKLSRVCTLVLALSLFAFSHIFAVNNYVKKLPIAYVDVQKYMGTWYEIARIPNYFEKGLVGVTATYSLNPDGTVKVVNQGFEKTLNGKKKQVVGSAKQVTGKPGAFRVVFFWPFSAGYHVIAIDKDYNYSLVIGDKPEYSWILSRKKTLDPAIIHDLVAKAKELGVQTEKYEWIEQ